MSVRELTYEQIGVAEAAPTDDGYYMRQVERMSKRREDRDTIRIRDGIAVAKLDKRYGAGIVEQLAADTNNSKSYLYMCQQVWCFYFRPDRQMSMRRLLRDFPELTFNHLRVAMRFKDYDTAIEALGMVFVGDPRLPEFDRSLPMTVDTFTVYANKRLGHSVPPKPLFDLSGSAWQVIHQFRERFKSAPTKKLRVQVWDLDEIGRDDE